MPIVAYALLIIGIPMYAGLLLGLAVAPLASPLRDSRKRLLLMDLCGVLQGAAAIGVGLVCFKICDVRPSSAALIIPLVWITFHSWAYRQGWLSWSMWVSGILIGWFALFTSLH